MFRHKFHGIASCFCFYKNCCLAKCSYIIHIVYGLFTPKVRDTLFYSFRGIKATYKGLFVLDSIVPTLLLHLEKLVMTSSSTEADQKTIDFEN